MQLSNYSVDWILLHLTVEAVGWVDLLKASAYCESLAPPFERPKCRMFEHLSSQFPQIGPRHFEFFAAKNIKRAPMVSTCLRCSLHQILHNRACEGQMDYHKGPNRCYWARKERVEGEKCKTCCCFVCGYVACLRDYIYAIDLTTSAYVSLSNNLSYADLTVHLAFLAKSFAC